MSDALGISIRNLKFSYSSSCPILDIEKLDIKKSKKVFIQGDSGSGKSTLLNLIAGVLESQQGEIKINDSILSSMSRAARDQFRADHMGFVFQMFNLIPYMSVQENILLSLQFTQEKKQKVKNPLNELERISQSLKLNKDLLNRRVTDLSVGQQQRVALARALMGSPEIVICDEPTSSLDFSVRDKFLDLLFKEVQQNQSTLLFVSHDVSLKNHFDETIELAKVNSAFHQEEFS